MKQLTVPAQVDRLGEVQAFIGALMSGANISEPTQNNIAVAVEEIFVNIASYAYPSGGGEATVRAEASPERVVIEFRDSGTPYDPLQKADPDTTLAAEDRQIGGLGIFMVRKMMDDVRYEYRDGQNILTIVKENR